MFERIPAYAGDPILSLIEVFLKDERPNKVNLGVGLYYDENGQIPLLESVRLAESARLTQLGPRSYLPMEGLGVYRQAMAELLFGKEHPVMQENRVATIQTIGGSAALKIGADFLKRYFPESQIWISDPSWDNHRVVFEGAGLAVNEYPYYDPISNNVRIEATLATLSELPAKSIVLFHPCCHNPTGVDFTREHWEKMIPIMVEKDLIAFMDMAYQGFADGLQEDAWPVRAMAQSGAACLVSSSFSKNLSFYGERCGGLSVVCRTVDESQSVLGQLKAGVRRIYSSPPTHGAAVVAEVLTNPQLRLLWEGEVAAMRQRIRAMRQKLYDVIQPLVPDRDLSYFLTQRGMFSYTGLTANQVDLLKEKYAIYLIRSGRMCIAGLNLLNVDYVANCFAKVMLEK
ncbi:aromatic amino acid transaminase [Ampullimonas aquatilis]|uniref:amino acid aminotransferase n=1 Tax=Ampullimonas aquatilis TaxID=1341549 RepID=UPI003C786AF0